MRPPRLRPLLVAAGLACACVACGSHYGPASPDGSTGDGAPPADGAAPPDALDGDAGDPCACAFPGDGPVLFFHECTPPLEMGCPATACEPGVTDCGEGRTCEPCSAAACCICSACAAACVRTGPAQGPLPEYLKLRQTHGPAGEAQDVVVQGFPFYIGALSYLARVGDSGDVEPQSGAGACSLAFPAPARGPGMVPVWISQYGGNEPWVLAGFFTYSAGELPSCAQPGHPCADGQTCCETVDVPMACMAGRCRRR